VDVVALGAAVLVHAGVSLADLTPQAWLQVSVGMAIAMLAGVFPVRIPHSKNSFAAGEIFIFLLLLIHGPAAAVLAAAGEAFVGSYRTSRRWTSRIVSPAMAALAMFAGRLLHTAAGARGPRRAGGAGLLVLATMGTRCCTSWQHAAGVGGAAPEAPASASSCPTCSACSAGSAWPTRQRRVAGLLFLTYRQSGIGVLMAVVPVLGMLLATLHYFFRQQEAAEAVRRSAEGRRARGRAGRAPRARAGGQRAALPQRLHACLDRHGAAVVRRPHPAGQRGAARAAGPRRRRAAPARPARVRRRRGPGAAETAPGAGNAQGLEDFSLELRCRHSDGERCGCPPTAASSPSPAPTTPCLILQVQDITARRNAEAGLQHIAFHDSLTGLPNRRRFHEHLAAGRRAQRSATRRQPSR
jgi:hypothetical protein